METKPIPFFAPVNRTIDGIAIGEEEGAFLFDGHLDERNEMARRPGLSLAVSLGSRTIRGGYYWDRGNVVFAVIGDSIWTLTNVAGVVSGSEQAITGLAPTGRPSWTTDGTYVYMACGGAIYRGTAAAGSFTALADADAPTHVTHVVFLDGYIIANDTTTGRFHFSTPADGSTWAAIDFANPESSPDIMHAMKEWNQELYFFGNESVEAWRDDGISPFSRIDGALTDIGCIAPQSPIMTEEGAYFFSSNKRLSVFDGRGVKELTTPYDKFFEELSAIKEAVGYTVMRRGKTFLVWTFPSDNVTVVLNYSDKNFSQWGKWESQKGDYDRFLGEDAVWARGWDKLLIMGRDGAVYFMSTAYPSDNGAPIRMCKRTGHIDQGTSKEKICEEIRIRVRRGDVVTTAPTLAIRFRNNNSTQWSNERQKSLGNTGETNMYIRLQRQGIYRSRQYELSMSGLGSAVIGSAEEDFSVLR